MSRTEELINWDRGHLFHSANPVGQNLSKVFERGKGVTLWDTDGKEYLDFASQLVCVNLGYNQSEIIDAAMEQMRKLPYSTMHFGFSNVPSIECSKKLTELTPTGLDYVW